MKQLKKHITFTQEACTLCSMLSFILSPFFIHISYPQHISLSPRLLSESSRTQCQIRSHSATALARNTLNDTICSLKRNIIHSILPYTRSAFVQFQLNIYIIYSISSLSFSSLAQLFTIDPNCQPNSFFPNLGFCLHSFNFSSPSVFPVWFLYLQRECAVKSCLNYYMNGRDVYIYRASI